MNIIQKIFSALFCFIFLICIVLYETPQKIYAETWICVNSEATLLEAINSSDSDIKINITGSFYLSQRCAIPCGKTVTLYSTSAQQIVSSTWGETMFWINNGATLKVQGNVTLNGNFQCSYNNQSSTIVNINSGGNFYLQGGTLCQSHEHGIFGQAGSNIYIESGKIYSNSAYGIGTYGNVTLSGGKIYNNNWGGIQSMGGSSTINMSGGEITNTSQQNGRNGIYISNSAVVNISGGNIENMGHAVYHNGSSCNIFGGTIGNNIYLTNNNYVTMNTYMNIIIEVQSFERYRTVIKMNNGLNALTQGEKTGINNRQEPWYLRAQDDTIKIWDQYLIDVKAGDNGISSALGGGKYWYGDTCTISSTSNRGYSFYGWTGDITNNCNPFEFIVTGNITALANSKVETITKTAIINWIDLSNKNGSRPDNVTLSLYRDEKKIRDYIVTGDNSVIAISNVWTHEINDLQKYNLNTGKEYNYKLIETVSSKHSDDIYFISYSNETWNITNTLNASPEPIIPKYDVKIIGNITWRDNNDQYHCRPDNVTIVLYQNGKYYKELTISSNSYEFNELPKYDDNLDPYIYTVSEEPIKNYTTFYNSYDTDIIAGNNTTKIYYCDINNTFKPEQILRYGNNELTISPLILDEYGNFANSDTYKKSCLNAGETNIYITLKQLTTVFVPIDAENGVYEETFSDDFSNIEYNLCMTDTTSAKITNILYGKYEISLGNTNVLSFKELKELFSKNATFSYENGKYYVTFSYAYEHEKEDLEIDFFLNSQKKYQNSISITNYFKVKIEQPIHNTDSL